jgi:hypothetical protein
MMVARMSIPKGYSGIGTGIPITVRSETNVIVMMSSTSPVVAPVPRKQVVLWETLVLGMMNSVLVAVNPVTTVKDVDDAVTEVVLLCTVTTGAHAVCIGVTEFAATGDSNAKTDATKNTYLTQLNPNTQPHRQVPLANIRLVRIPSRNGGKHVP